MSDYALSIIIPTARYSPVLVELIKYIHKTFSERGVEIVIVSTADNPGNRIYSLLCGAVRGCKLLILERNPSRDSRSLHKNIAVSASKGKYIYIIDDDATPTSKLLETVLEMIERETCDAILHPVIPKPVSIWARVRMIEKIYSSFDPHQSSSRIMERSLFIMLGGYRADLVLGEDIEFQQRLLRGKPRICVIPLSGGFEIHHGEYRTIEEYVRRAWYYGRYVDALVRQMDPLTIYRAYVRVPLRLVSSMRSLFFAYLFYKCVSLLCVVLRALLARVSKSQ